MGPEERTLALFLGSGSGSHGPYGIVIREGTKLMSPAPLSSAGENGGTKGNFGTTARGYGRASGVPSSATQCTGVINRRKTRQTGRHMGLM